MIYLTGYHGHKPQDLRTLALNLEAVVVDIRLSPVSKMAEWNKVSLMNTLAARYMVVQEFGNVNYKNGGEIRIKNPTEGANRLMRRGAKNYILLCGCRDAETCHRTVVGDFLRTVSIQAIREVTAEEWAAATPAPEPVVEVTQREWLREVQGEFPVVEQVTTEVNPRPARKKKVVQHD